MGKKFKILLVIGVLVRLLLAMVTYHSDINALLFAGRVLQEGNITNFYDYLWRLPEGSRVLSVYPRDLFNYPFTVYAFYGVSSFVATIPFYSFATKFIFDIPSVLGDFRLFIFLALLKLPYGLFDFGIAYTLYKFFENRRDKIVAVLLWLFNPVNLYATYMVGQFDIIPTFFVVLALYFAARRHQAYKSALFLGIGGAFKIFPLMLLVPLAATGNSWAKRIAIILVGMGTYILTLLPFIGSSGFRSTALVANQTTKSLYVAFPVSGGEAIFPFISVMVFAYIYFIQLRGGLQDLWRRWALIFLIFFVFTHFHPQWLLWITPFFVLDLVVYKMRNWWIILALIFVFIAMISFFDSGLSLGLFAPLFPNLYNRGEFWNLLGVNIDYNFARSILQSLFAAIAFYFGFLYLQSANEENK